MISAAYLNKGDIIDIYLDIIHELTHIKQFKEGNSSKAAPTTLRDPQRLRHSATLSTRA